MARPRKELSSGLPIRINYNRYCFSTNGLSSSWKELTAIETGEAKALPLPLLKRNLLNCEIGYPLAVAVRVIPRCDCKN